MMRFPILLLTIAVLAQVAKGLLRTQTLSHRPFFLAKTAISMNPPAQPASLGTMGSDILVRPDNEDSPEFKEYLKNLMRLQANRARTGYASPSSGSADAYIAKLNRLKVERDAFRKAGLPDAPLDVNYKEEDYEAALYVLFHAMSCYVMSCHVLVKCHNDVIGSIPLTEIAHYTTLKMSSNTRIISTINTCNIFFCIQIIHLHPRNLM